MKKIIATALVLAITVLCFTACGSKVIDGTKTLTDFAGGEYAVVTEENGELERDQAGNLIVKVTDENGKKNKDSKGEDLTQIQPIEHTLVIGNNIELQDYYLTIPKGWSNNNSFHSLQIKKNNSADAITIDQITDKPVTEVEKNAKGLVDAAIKANSNAVPVTKGIEINGKSCPCFGVYVPETSNGSKIYIAYIIYENDRGVFRFYINSDRNVDENDKEIVEILNSVVFKGEEKK